MKYLSILSVLLLIGGNFSFAMEEDKNDVNENTDYTQKPNKTRLQKLFEKYEIWRQKFEEELKKEELKEEGQIKEELKEEESKEEGQIKEELKKEDSKENELEEELNITKKKRINNHTAMERHERVMKSLREKREELRNRIQKMYEQGKVSKELKEFYDYEIQKSYFDRKIFSDITKEINELDEKQDTKMIKDLEYKYKNMYPYLSRNEEEDVFVMNDFSTEPKEDSKINSDEEQKAKSGMKMKGPTRLK